jgi:hypothetical protein
MKQKQKNKSRSHSGGGGPKEYRPGASINQTSQARVIGISLFLAVLTLVVFSRTFHYGFVNYDDDGYVYQNAVVQQGLTLSGIGWAFQPRTPAAVCEAARPSAVASAKAESAHLICGHSFYKSAIWRRRR